ncbi:MAG: inositol monophosphatase [Patescibacteria group bacterium]|jgi:myo-inositol-1(or 4)-monophosphatase|nr:inositol monophosphatase [Patescibacteria group bacterium]
MKDFTVKLALQAGQEIAKRFTRQQIVKYKTKRQVVTQADLIADRIITKAIKQKFPAHNIISEESGLLQNQSEYTWVIDPLDGTTNFTLGINFFAVSIALFKSSQPIMGVIYDPINQTIYTAQQGKGSYLNNRRLKVSARNKISDSILTFCHGEGNRDINRVSQIRQRLIAKAKNARLFGCASLELGLVASGRTESFLVPSARSWDVGAGVIIVREAGGAVTDFKGQNWNIKSKDMVASNDLIHRELIKILKTI